ncbi:unnamed protein product [Bacillus thuringiensis DB27]|uniref:Uncharacterized protein n=1 Tax=Bacillus thuringiensis DB27 TaxID=1431339 RepID=W8YMW8_BACTU|nr:unnamed protein product [Bacillus thuringiensis DB27]
MLTSHEYGIHIIHDKIGINSSYLMKIKTNQN